MQFSHVKRAANLNLCSVLIAIPFHTAFQRSLHTISARSRTLSNLGLLRPGAEHLTLRIINAYYWDFFLSIKAPFFICQTIYLFNKRPTYDNKNADSFDFFLICNCLAVINVLFKYQLSTYFRQDVVVDIHDN